MTKGSTRRARTRISLGVKSATGAAIAALLSAACAGSAQAASTFQPGFTTGLPVYAVFPVGLYLIDVPQYGVRNSKPTFDLGAESPFFFFASPFKLFGAQINAQFSPTFAATRVAGGASSFGLYNTYFGAGMSWDLGNGWFTGNRLAGWIPQDGPVAFPYGTMEYRWGVTYLKDGIDFTANLIGNQPIKTNGADGPDALVLDLTLTKTIGKWELGGVGFGSADLTKPNATYRRQRQFALGPLVGYDFGTFKVQVKATSDVAQENYGGRDRRIWANIILPVWLDSPPPAPIKAKY